MSLRTGSLREIHTIWDFITATMRTRNLQEVTISINSATTSSIYNKNKVCVRSLCCVYRPLVSGFNEFDRQGNLCDICLFVCTVGRRTLHIYIAEVSVRRHIVV